MGTTVSILGSTGSIGTQAIDVIVAELGRFEVKALAAGRSIDLLADQAMALRPELVVVADDIAATKLDGRLPAGTEIMVGDEGLRTAAALSDVAVNAVVGFAGLPVTLAALQAGRRLALANKESLIAGAPVVQPARQTPGAQIIPVDSEHCALHQCLTGTADPQAVARLLITASGGPFRGRTPADMADVTVAQALAHPTWNMGPKITIDSSTLMNKGLEVIEAHELFFIDYDDIEVVVHPQSVIHSMVEFCDGAVLAQLSNPDMRLPLAYALCWPQRSSTAFGALDFTAAMTLTFEPPDRSLFVALELAYAAGRAGGLAPAWLSAANEIAVEAFLAERISWIDITTVVAAALDRLEQVPVHDVGDVLEADRQARACARQAVDKLAR